MHVGHKKGGKGLVKRGGCNVRIVMPGGREWLSVRSCVNVRSNTIPSFYMFKCRSFRRNFMSRCEKGTCMAMQNKAFNSVSYVQR